MKVTRKKYFAAINPTCSMLAPEAEENIVRLQGKGTHVDLIALVKEWLGDDTIRRRDLADYFAHVRKVSGLGVGGLLRNPRKGLETLLERMEALERDAKAK